MPKKWKVETEQIQQFANPISIHFQLCQGQDAPVSGASRVSAIEIWSLAESSGKAVDWGNLQKSLVTDELKVSYVHPTSVAWLPRRLCVAAPLVRQRKHPGTNFESSDLWETSMLMLVHKPLDPGDAVKKSNTQNYPDTQIEWINVFPFNQAATCRFSLALWWLRSTSQGATRKVGGHFRDTCQTFQHCKSQRNMMKRLCFPKILAWKLLINRRMFLDRNQSSSIFPASWSLICPRVHP